MKYESKHSKLLSTERRTGFSLPELGFSLPELGFSLLELMVVLVIIGIFSAVAIPGIMEIRYRNTLTDSTARIRAAGGATRDLAMLTRQATVLEVSADGVWVNLLSGPSCDSDIEKRCTPTGFISLFDADSLGSVAGVAMCGGAVLSLDDGSCEAVTDLSRTDGFALCYSGAGELYFRVGKDTNTVCSSSVQPTAGKTWVQACSAGTAAAVAFADETAYNLEDGAVLMLNRYDAESVCQNGADAPDMGRLVIFPTNGSPFSVIAED